MATTHVIVPTRENAWYKSDFFRAMEENFYTQPKSKVVVLSKGMRTTPNPLRDCLSCSRLSCPKLAYFFDLAWPIILLPWRVVGSFWRHIVALNKGFPTMYCTSHSSTKVKKLRTFGAENGNFEKVGGTHRVFSPRRWPASTR